MHAASMPPSPLHLVEEVATARNTEELHLAIQRAASRLGFDTYCFGMFYNEPGSGEPQYFSIDNYRSSWVEHYTQSRYQEVDIAVTHCAGHTTPLVWTRKLYEAPHLKPLEEEGFSGVLFCGQPEARVRLKQQLAAREGPILPLISRAEDGYYPLYRLVKERTVCVNTASAGGDTSLLMLGDEV